jgi:hypothetical protein
MVSRKDSKDSKDNKDNKDNKDECHPSLFVLAVPAVLYVLSI